VNLGERSYRVLVGEDLAGEMARTLAGLPGCRRVALVSHPILARLHRDAWKELEKGLSEAGIGLRPLFFPAGERHKNLRTVARLYRGFLEMGLERSDAVLAWGGGVVGDLAGFAAATYQRGVGLVQAPTTLMAMVDSSIGGKVGVDLPQGKNLVGAFHQPRAVFCDVTLLRTLPRREFVSGLAEVAKYALVFDGGFHGRLKERAPALLAREGVALRETVAACAAYKARMVEEDELDLKGRRILLNYGHTFGHALETVTGYREMLHGEAVALGMLMAARLAGKLGLAGKGLYREHRELLTTLALQADPLPGVTAEGVLAAMAFDKKRAGGRTRFVLLRGVGKPEVVELEECLGVAEAVREELEG